MQPSSCVPLPRSPCSFPRLRPPSVQSLPLSLSLSLSLASWPWRPGVTVAPESATLAIRRAMPTAPLAARAPMSPRSGLWPASRSLDGLPQHRGRTQRGCPRAAASEDAHLHLAACASTRCRGQHDGNRRRRRSPLHPCHRSRRAQATPSSRLEALSSFRRPLMESGLRLSGARDDQTLPFCFRTSAGRSLSLCLAHLHPLVSGASHCHPP